MSDTLHPAKRASLTVRDIGRLAGVSAMTVSRAFNEPALVSPETLQRVMDVVKRTGFVPNGVARGLRSSKAKLVAALVPTLVGPVFQEMVQALNQTLHDHGYQLMIGQTGYDSSGEETLLDAVVSRRPDGIVLLGTMQSAEGRRRLQASGIPVVETWDLTSTPIDMLVGFSHERIGESVARYLQAHGYRRLGLISADDVRARRRAEGFQAMAARLRLAKVSTVFSPPPSTAKAGRAGAAQLLDSARPVRAIFCSSDMMALGALTEAQSRGIAVPGELAIIGLGDQDFAASLQPALTTVRIDGTRIGRLAAQLIIDRSEGKTPEQPVVDVGFSIVERSSA